MDLAGPPPPPAPPAPLATDSALQARLERLNCSKFALGERSVNDGFNLIALSCDNRNRNGSHCFNQSAVLCAYEISNIRSLLLFSAEAEANSFEQSTSFVHGGGRGEQV